MEPGHRRGNGTTQRQHSRSKRAPRSSIRLLQPYPRRQEQGFWHQDPCKESSELHSFYLQQLLLFKQGPSWMEPPQVSGEGANFPPHQASGPPSQKPCPAGATLVPNGLPGIPLGQQDLMRVGPPEHATPLPPTEHTGGPHPHLLIYSPRPSTANPKTGCDAPSPN